MFPLLWLFNNEIVHMHKTITVSALAKNCSLHQYSYDVHNISICLRIVLDTSQIIL